MARLNVDVAPSWGPLVPRSRVKLWGVDELLVKAILTMPALLLKVLVVKASWPLGSAAIESEPAEPPAARLDAAVELAELELGAADELLELGAADELLELGAADELLLEPPHALSASAAVTATARGASGDMELLWVRAAGRKPSRRLAGNQVDTRRFLSFPQYDRG